MPVRVQSLDGLVLDGLVAALALGQGHVGEAPLAVGLLLVLVVAGLGRELLVAAVAAEAAGAPSLLHRLHAVLEKREKYVDGMETYCTYYFWATE